MRKDTIRQWANLLVFGAMVAANGLANALPLNGQTTGEISVRFQVERMSFGQDPDPTC